MPSPATPLTTPAADNQPARSLGLDQDEARRHAFLLHHLTGAKDRRLLLGDVTKRLKTNAAVSLGFNDEVVSKVRETLVAGGYLRVEKVGRGVWYQVTEGGVAYLGTLQEFAPIGPGRGKVHPASNEDVRQARVAYLLLQLLQGRGHSLSSSVANKATSQSRTLELNAATSRHVRSELAARGLLTIERGTRSERYTLTDAGRLHLGTLAFYESFRFRLTGKELNLLLEAAREAAKEFTPMGVDAAQAPATEAPTAGDLAEAILKSFEDLRRERHTVSGMVPIHEVRAEVRARFGPAAARHAVFDEAVLSLWREKRVRLTSIADRGKATPEQLQNSIPGVGETLFYLEVAREPASV